MLNKTYKLEELDIQKNLINIMNTFGVIHVSNIYTLNVRKETPIDEAKYVLLRCISFMNKMHIFYLIDDADEAKLNSDDFKFSIYEKSDDSINESQNIIEKYHFNTQYFSNNIEYEFLLVEKNSVIFLTDQGRTYDMLDNIFELKTPDVQKFLNAIMKNCGVIQARNELIIPIKSFEIIRNYKDNKEIIEAKYRLFECVLFVDTMRIFFV